LAKNVGAGERALIQQAKYCVRKAKVLDGQSNSAYPLLILCAPSVDRLFDEGQDALVLELTDSQQSLEG